ncbi:IQ motif-containing protein H isoform X5 [Channa argus]|uniref:IQ motif-containing protein H isoform X5 n=1 Tax=Channa argus TaxID=215402 RepID=UPI0035223112
MYNARRNEEEMGAVLVKVKDDLKQLKRSLEKITVNERAKILDIQTLDIAIHKTESSIRKHAEDYLTTVTRRLLVLPSIEDVHKTAQIPKWKPPIKSIRDVGPPRKLPSVVSPVKKTKHHRVIAGPVASFQAIEPRGHHNLAKPEQDSGMGLIGLKSRCHKKLKWKSEPGSTCNTTGREFTTPWITKTPPPSTTSKSMDHGGLMQDHNYLPKSPQNLTVQPPFNVIKYPFTIINGRVNPMAVDFYYFKQSYSLSWSRVVFSLEALEKLLRDFAVPLAKVIGERLVELGHNLNIGWRKVPPVISLLSVLENWEEVLDLVLQPGQRYKGEGGTEAAAILIQSCWRRHVARTAYLCHCRRKWAARTIAISWWMHMQMRRVRKALQARRFRQLENYRSRAQHLATNWKHIQSSKRTIIHIPSLGYSQSQRLNLKGFDILQNTQISRLCDIRDGNVEVIYVCPRHLQEDILHYYTSLLKGDGATVEFDTKTTEAPSGIKRFIILTPEALDYFPTQNMCLSTLLKYSPHTLKRIRNLIQGKRAYIVGGVAHVDDLAVADELGVPVLGPEPAVVELYSTKSGGRMIFIGAEVDVPPGRGDTYSLTQLHETLAELIVQNMDVQRWVFKMDSENRGQGTAYCDICHLSCYSWALQEYHHCGPELWNTKWIQVWAIDLNLAYSDQLAMTQMLLMITGGTLNFRTGCLEVPIPIAEKCCEQQITPKPPVLNCYAVIGIHLFHSNLSMLYHCVFFKMCKAHGIGFDKKCKQGTVFALYDSSDRCSIGMITVSEDLQRALVTFARNLSDIHQEISSSKMQGETNFKGLIKNIEDVLMMITQNKLLAVEDKPA